MRGITRQCRRWYISCLPSQTLVVTLLSASNSCHRGTIFIVHQVFNAVIPPCLIPGFVLTIPCYGIEGIGCPHRFYNWPAYTFTYNGFPFPINGIHNAVCSIRSRASRTVAWNKPFASSSSHAGVVRIWLPVLRGYAALNDPIRSNDRVPPNARKRCAGFSLL